MIRTFAPLFCCLAACTSYSPAPVDLGAHAAAFAARLPDSDEIIAVADRIARRTSAARGYDPRDGLTRAEARLLTLWLHPELRRARLQVAVTAAGKDHAGTWPDPQLNADFARILEHVEHPWLAGGALGITLPLFGRSGAATAVADREHAAARLQARAAETAALDALDSAWLHWSAARMRGDLLQDLLTRIRTLEALALRLADHGELTRLAARAFTLERLAREAEHASATTAIATTRLHLLHLLGLPPDTTLELIPDTAIEDRAGAADDRRPQLLTGPAVQPAEHAHALAERQLELAIAEQWPDLTLLPGFGEEDAEPRALLGFSLPLPLWNRNARAIAEATATRELRAEELRLAVEHATARLATADVRLAGATAQRLMLTRDLLPAVAAQVADGQRMAELGQLDPLLLLDTLTRAHEAQLAVIDAGVAEGEATITRNTLFWPEAWLPAAEEIR